MTPQQKRVQKKRKTWRQSKRKILAKIIIIIIIIIYNIYRALIPNGPKALYIIKITTKS